MGDIFLLTENDDEVALKCSSLVFLSRFLILVFLIFQVTEECLERAISVCNNGALFRKIGKRIRFKDYVQFFF